MKRALLFMSAALAIMLIPSCATIFSGTTAKVTVSSPNAAWANLSVDGEKYNNIVFPATIKVKRGFKPSIIEAENPEMEGSVTVDKGFNSVTLWNILLGGVPGFIIDAADGAIMKPTQKNYTILMNPKKKSKAVEDDSQKVSREKSGGTNLENTIIRWDVQSRPQGADIFWRVVSTSPDVKSTNNKYLMTTPYEATKSLDINGLSYETSGNVRIILRCEKDGYMSQEKEFNVRMVLDQEEISAFFRLVKEE